MPLQLDPDDLAGPLPEDWRRMKLRGIQEGLMVIAAEQQIKIVDLETQVQTLTDALQHAHLRLAELRAEVDPPDDPSDDD